MDSTYSISPHVIRRDLADERPGWILSSYGPGKDPPEQLFGGPIREQSFEEMRLHYMQGLVAGNPQGAINDIQVLNQNAEQQIQTALGNLDAAIQFIVDGKNKHPNRIDICQQGTGQGGTTGEFAVGKPRDPAFGGQPTRFGQQTTAFGATTRPSTSAFGAPSQPPAGGFGQPSALGQKPNPFGTPAFGQSANPAGAPAFGQPANPAGAPAFGQPSQPSSGFGQPSALGAKPNPFGTPAFGQPAQPAATPAFGQPAQQSSTTTFGQARQPGITPAFGQPSQPGGAPTFGQPSQPGTAPAFGQPSQPAAASGFGQPSQLNAGFGQTSALGQKPNPFGAPAAPTLSPFAIAGAQQPAAQNAFGQTPQTQNNANPFGGPSTGQPAANPFGQPAASTAFGAPMAPAAATSFGQQPQAQVNAFGAPTASGNNAGATFSNAGAMDTSSSSIATSTPFGAPTGPSAKPVAAAPFGAPTGPSAKPTTANPFGQPATAPPPFGQQPNGTTATTPASSPSAGGPYGPDATRQHPPLYSYASKGPDGQLRMFKSKAVSYQVLRGSENQKPQPVMRSSDGTPAKIWFPDGPPAYSRDTEAADEKVYGDPGVIAKWKTFMDTGRFGDGVMPEVPPKREWCVWDF